LQPLDVGVFGPLSTAYSNELNKLLYDSLGLVSMTKRLFYPLFKAAYEASFTQKNIEHAFEKAGIWPVNSEKVISKLQTKVKTTQAETEPTTPRTPLTSRSVRNIQKLYKASRRESILDLILRANKQLAAQVEINEHVMRGLRRAIKIEQKRRKQGKRLNLLGEEDNGPQFFSPSRVQAALEYQAEKEALEHAERLRIADKKAQQAANKVRKEAEKAERAIQRALRRQHAQEERAQKEAEKKARQATRQALQAAKQAEIQAKKAAKLAEKPAPKLKISAPPKKKHVVVSTKGGITRGVKVASPRATRTQAVFLPQRYQ
jgi:hypothetical protein